MTQITFDNNILIMETKMYFFKKPIVTLIILLLYTLKQLLNNVVFKFHM